MGSETIFKEFSSLLNSLKTFSNGELVTGTEKFKAEIGAMLGRKTQVGKRGRPRKSTEVNERIVVQHEG